MQTNIEIVSAHQCNGNMYLFESNSTHILSKTASLGISFVRHPAGRAQSGVEGVKARPHEACGWLAGVGPRWDMRLIAKNPRFSGLGVVTDLRLWVSGTKISVQ